MLFDTDVLVWVLQNHLKAAELVNETEDRHLSIVSYMELLQGARNRNDLRTIKDFVSDYSFQVLPLTQNIGHRGLVYIEEYGLQIQLLVADALIAATATENHLPLCTANDKHFRVIRELDLQVFRP